MIEEKRTGSRIPCSGAIVFRGVNHQRHYQGVMQDIGSEGMCIQTSFPVKVGMGICLRITGPIETDIRSSIKPRSMTLAEVRWCEQIEQGSAVDYRMGLKYMLST